MLEEIFLKCDGVAVVKQYRSSLAIQFIFWQSRLFFANSVSFGATHQSYLDWDKMNCIAKNEQYHLASIDLQS